MYTHTKEAYHYDSDCGKIPIEVCKTERLVRFLQQGSIKKGKPKPKIFRPQDGIPNKISLHRLEYSDQDHCKRVGLSVHKQYFVGLALVGAKHCDELGMSMISEIEDNGVTQHINLYLPTAIKKFEPATSEETDLFYKLYEFVKLKKLYYVDKEVANPQWQGGQLSSREKCLSFSVFDETPE